MGTKYFTLSISSTDGLVHSPSRLAWSEGRRPLGAVLHLSNKPGELSQWLFHDGSTINIGIIIIIIIMDSCGVFLHFFL